MDMHLYTSKPIKHDDAASADASVSCESQRRPNIAPSGALPVVWEKARLSKMPPVQMGKAGRGTPCTRRETLRLNVSPHIYESMDLKGSDITSERDEEWSISGQDVLVETGPFDGPSDFRCFGGDDTSIECW